MKIYLAQYSPALGDVNKNLIKMEEIIKTAIKEEADIVVFPELALTGYLLEELVFQVAIDKVPKELIELSEKISIIFGAVELSDDNYIYNTAYYLENGELLHKHRKVYLPTYGMFDESRYFKAGGEIKSFQTKFGRIGILICEDAWHQASSFILAQDKAEHIFVLVNSPARGFGEELSIEKEWNSLIHSAAISNIVYVTMSNRVGVEDGISFWGGSKIIAPTGEVVYCCDKFKEEKIMVKIDKDAVRRARFSGPVGKNENIPLIMKELKRIWKG